MTDSDRFNDYEKMASFYLGKKYDLATRTLSSEKLLYDAKDLTTHAMCVGMTGSGKTGLCLALLEDAALDGIPAICIDPKGDLGNLLLAFPELSPAEFRDWVEPSEASRQGLDVEQYAEKTAKKWREGLESWDQTADRIKRYRQAVDIAIYTPGSSAGIPMTVLKSFDAPPPEVMQDSEVLRERISGAASGLLTLMGVGADPLSSREHILLSNIFDHAWRKGQSLDLPSLIRSIQSPPLEKIGVFDLESFYPAADRLKLSMSLNNLLASPSFAGWLEGQSLDIKSLLHTKEGKPRLSIISIAHLGDSERMFFVTILLNELLSWIRTQTGTVSLRALFYMDEVFGYFPPTAKPPSKPPMLVLLKQARAFGLGIVLATQNPVDLDYKGLSNIGTWFLGRLQTQRDKDRVLEGLEGAAAQTGSKFNRSEMEQTLAALGSRVFLMNNVHDDGPTIFQSRWAMSYLRGPLSREHIKKLMDPRRDELIGSNSSLTGQSGEGDQTASDNALDSGRNAKKGSQKSTSVLPSNAEASRPIVPNNVLEKFWVPAKFAAEGSQLCYRPALLASVSCHYVRASADLDIWLDKTLVVLATKKLPRDVWKDALMLEPGSIEFSTEPEDGYFFEDLPAEMMNDKSYKAWDKDIRDHLYRRVPVRMYECVELKAMSKPEQDEFSARMDWQQQMREMRDREIELLRDKYDGKLRSLESKIRTAEQRVERERSQYDAEKWKTALSFGETILGALLGNKSRSRASTTTRGIGRAARERSDMSLANESLNDLLRDKRDLIDECERDVEQLKSKFRVENLTLRLLEFPCRKGDIKVHLLSLLWIPFQVTSTGAATPLVDLRTVKSSQM